MTISTVVNLIIWLIGKLFHRFSVANNAVLSEFSWKRLQSKGVNKSPFKDMKICKSLKRKH